MNENKDFVPMVDLFLKIETLRNEIVGLKKEICDEIVKHRKTEKKLEDITLYISGLTTADIIRPIGVTPREAMNDETETERSA